ncbi:MAG: amidohydrolase family protein [Oscillibacter sp.]|nr:amidohydrolase family protein [Oscillibacter sp.]
MEEKRSCDLLICHCGAILPGFQLLEDAAIAVEAGRILEIGKAEALLSRYQPRERLEAGGKLAMPGMVDCHTHTVQQLLKGGTVDEPPIVWRRILVPYESRMTPEDRYHAARLYCLQALRAGITLFADAGSMDMTGTVQAVTETGIRAAIARVGRDMDPELPACMCDPTAEQSIDAMERLYRDYDGSAGGRIRIWFSLSSPMSSSPQLVEGVALAAKARGTGIHIHLGEHPAEVQTCLSRWGLRPPAFLDRYGALGSNVIAAHCIQITDFDIRLMAQRGLHVIHCPTANLPTQGIPKLLAERAAGLNIALGNDGATSAKQDLFGQAQLLKYVTQAVYGTPVFEPNVLPLAEAFAMMTANGARALGMGEQLGTLETGKLADIVLLRTDGVNYLPSRNLLHTMMMVASSQDVSDVLVGGKLLLRDGQFAALDETEILRQGRAQMEDLLRRTESR